MELFRREFLHLANNWNQKRLVTSLVKLHGEPSEVSDIEQKHDCISKKKKQEKGSNLKEEESMLRSFGSDYQATSR